MELTVFYIFAAVAVAAAVTVVAQKRAVYSALALIVCFGSMAVLFFQLGAHFIGAVQVIVYAGAIMVLFIFVIMLLDPESEIFPRNRLKRLTVFGFAAAVFLTFALWRVFPQFERGDVAAAANPLENTTMVARLLFRDYLLPFEVTSILILVAVMGAVVLAKRPN